MRVSDIRDYFESERNRGRAKQIIAAKDINSKEIQHLVTVQAKFPHHTIASTEEKVIIGAKVLTENGEEITLAVDLPD